MVTIGLGVSGDQKIIEDMNTVPDNYASAKVTFLHPIEVQFRKNPYISNIERI